MTVIAAKINRPVVIRQAMLAGNNFTGVAPETGAGPIDPTFASDIYKFDDLVAGGLFDLPSATLYAFEPRESLALTGVEFDFGGPTVWSLNLVDVDAKEIVLWSGTETTFVVTEDTRVTLPWGTTLKLTTSGATNAMHAALKLVPEWFLYAGNR